MSKKDKSLDDLLREFRGDEPAEPHWATRRDQAVAGKKEKTRVKPITPNQGKYFKAIETSTVTLCTGPAGTGKTYMACGIAAGMLKDDRIGKIVLTRPLVTCGDGVGFLPGDLGEKTAPFMRPLLDAFGDFFSPHELHKLSREGRLEVVPLEYMRGMTLKDCVAVCDEAQNASFGQLRMLLTRVGPQCRLVITGDAFQSDLPYRDANSLLRVINRFRPNCHPEVAIVRLYKEDIVRHGIIQWIEERLTGSEPTEEKNDAGAC